MRAALFLAVSVASLAAGCGSSVDIDVGAGGTVEQALEEGVDVEGDADFVDAQKAQTLVEDPALAGRVSVQGPSVEPPPVPPTSCAATCQEFETCVVRGAAFLSKVHRGVWGQHLDTFSSVEGPGVVGTVDGYPPYTEMPVLDPRDCAAACPAFNDPDYGVEEYASPCETPAQVKARLAAVKSRWDRIQRNSHDRLVIAHRGNAEFAADNTIDGSRTVYQMGADGVERDYRWSIDGVPFIFHDDMSDQILRSAGVPGGRTWNQLRNAEFRDPDVFGAHVVVPTVFEAFAVDRAWAGLVFMDWKGTEPALSKAQSIWMLESILIALRMQTHIVNYYPYVLDVNHNVNGNPSTGSISNAIGMAAFIDDDANADPVQLSAYLAGGWPMVQVDDVRPILAMLGRPAQQPSCHAAFPARTFTASGNVQQLLATLATCAPLQNEAATLSRVGSLLTLSAAQALYPSANAPGGYPVNGSSATYSAATDAAEGAALDACARAADALGSLALTPSELALLQSYGWNRGIHRRWQYHDIDGATAVASVMRQAPPGTAVTFVEQMLDRVANPAVDPLAWWGYSENGWGQAAPSSYAYRGRTDWRGKTIVWYELHNMSSNDAQTIAWYYLNKTTAQQDAVGANRRIAARTLTRLSQTQSTVQALWNDPRYQRRAVLEAIDAAAAGDAWAAPWIAQNAPYATSWISAHRCRQVLPPTTAFSTSNPALASTFP